MSLVEQLIPLQRRLNAEMRSSTPAERAALAKQCIYAMAAAEPEEWSWLIDPKDDENPDVARPGDWERD